ncbi:MAG TPA: alpha/beta hydrolase-fold protein [Urbifossiella sp.]|jgi:S-formylglutathione hydrolase FrmB|nr:alpha/beta hydrolase-fold protein [Urbifossiella sp.]
MPRFSAVLVLLAAAVAGPAGAAEPKPFPGTPTKWQGFARYDFKHAGRPAIVVAPDRPLPGRPWVWRGEFFGAFADADAALVKAGWHLAYLTIPDQFGSPTAVKAWEGFHATLVNDHCLHPKPGLIGLSRGGLYCMNWAAAHPDKTLAVYLDNAVCDFKSWPGGRVKGLGAGPGSADEWRKLLAAYEFKSDADAAAYKLNPVDNLAPVARAGIPLLIVYGDADRAVPPRENSEMVFPRYRALGGHAVLVAKPGQDHHPHGLADVSPVVRFFADSFAADGAVGAGKRAADGIITHEVKSPYQSGPTLVRVLPPDDIEKGRPCPVVYVLPVEVGTESRYGDALAEVRRLGLHNRLKAAFVAPTFSALPWYADHPTRPELRQEAHLLAVVVPFVQRTYPVRADADGRLLLGFSKSGWGAYSLLLRNPDVFGRAAAWDAPLMMDAPGRYGSGDAFGTPENFRRHELTRLVEQRAAVLRERNRLVLTGYGNFRDDHQRFHALLEKLNVPHDYRDGPQVKHDWQAGWVEEATRLLLPATP